MTVLVTGAAGFIGAHVCRRLRADGHAVVGLDNLNGYYDPALKRDRVSRLIEAEAAPGRFRFVEADIADPKALQDAADGAPISHVIHLAAQAGVRYSIDAPFAYAKANLVGHLSVLEYARHCDTLDRVVYASSSSVYGGSADAPFREDAPVNAPVSLYAATKAADELMSATYAHLYGISLIGLRFFTVYGAWGRPDMAYWLFTEAILRNEPIRVFNHGEMRRDFTYIDDIVEGVIRATFRDVALPADRPHRVYNLGNNNPVELGAFIEVLEDALGRPAQKHYEAMQPGDVVQTCADIKAIHRDFDWLPTTRLEDGLPHFVAWYREYFTV